MAAWTKVRRDSHGQCFRADGHVFRPEPSETARGYVVPRDPHPFADGERVKVYHIAQSPLGSIRSADGLREARWYSHGVYIHESGPTDRCWRPKEGQ